MLLSVVALVCSLASVLILTATMSGTAILPVDTDMLRMVVMTGAINGWMIVGPDNIAGLPATPYGKLLLAKLVLFGAMLAIAAANRWALTPRLERHIATGAYGGAAQALRFSLTVELTIELGILPLVSWLGTLARQA